MIPPFDVWAPMFRAPFSGDVVQEIAPRVPSPEFKGSPEVRYKVQTEVASYGTQLGKILHALMIEREALPMRSDPVQRAARLNRDRLTNQSIAWQKRLFPSRKDSSIRAASSGHTPLEDVP